MRKGEGTREEGGRGEEGEERRERGGREEGRMEKRGEQRNEISRGRGQVGGKEKLNEE